MIGCNPSPSPTTLTPRLYRARAPQLGDLAVSCMTFAPRTWSALRLYIVLARPYSAFTPQPHPACNSWPTAGRRTRFMPRSRVPHMVRSPQQQDIECSSHSQQGVTFGLVPGDASHTRFEPRSHGSYGVCTPQPFVACGLHPIRVVFSPCMLFVLRSPASNAVRALQQHPRLRVHLVRTVFAPCNHFSHAVGVSNSGSHAVCAS